MADLSMHEGMPFDEATTPPPISTGELPRLEEVRDVVTEAYERYRTERRRAPWPTTSRRSPRRRRTGSASPWSAPGAGRSRSVTSTTAFSIQSVSKPFVFALVCEAIGYAEARQPARRQQHRVPVQLADGRRAERRPHDEPAGQRRRDRHHQPGARRHGRREVGAGARRAVALRRPRAHRQRGGLRLRVGHQPAQPGHRPPARELRPALLRPRRGHRRLHPAVLAGGDRPRPRRDGGDPGQRRREPGDR